MARTRPVVAPTFGQLVRDWRGKRNRSAVVALVAKKGVKFGVGTLRFWESGLTAAPSPVVLRALADVLGKSVGDALSALEADSRTVAQNVAAMTSPVTGAEVQHASSTTREGAMPTMTEDHRWLMDFCTFARRLRAHEVARVREVLEHEMGILWQRGREPKTKSGGG